MRSLVDPVHFPLEDLFPPDEFHGDVVVVELVGIEDRAAPKVAEGGRREIWPR